MKKFYFKEFRLMNLKYLPVHRNMSVGVYDDDWLCVPNNFKGKFLKLLWACLFLILQPISRAEAKIFGFQNGELFPKLSISFWIGTALTKLDRLFVLVPEELIRGKQ